MIDALALTVVISAGMFFVALGGVSLFAPSHASRFLLGFADSLAKHYTELAVRFLVGGAFVLAAPRAYVSGMFSFLGWVLLATTVGLLLIPWRWHHRFARRAVPEALRFLPLIGASSVVLGGLVLWSVFRGSAV